MGYFSNGSEGVDYESKYCEKCIHFENDNGDGCAVFKTKELAEQNRHLFEETDVAIDARKVSLTKEELKNFNKGIAVFV